MSKPLFRLALAWMCLLLLLALTLAMAYVPLGRGNIAVAMAIATAKGVIVLLVFMKLIRSPPLTWIFAGAGLFWLVILFGLSFTDYATRAGFPPQP
jgi:cytochrome c oxidase subunit 4